MRLLVLLITATNAFAQTLTGTVVDTRDNRPLSFVNIGVLGKNMGTVSREDGSFTLFIRDMQPTDTLKVSYLGYEPQLFFANNLPKNGPLRVKLVEKAIILDEVDIAATNAETKTLGLNRASHFKVTGWGNKAYGGERGIKISTKTKGQFLVKEVGMHVADNKYDSVLVRLRIRKLEKGIPGDDILSKNVYITVPKMKGWFTADLNNYQVSIPGKEDFVASIELVRSWGECSSFCFILSLNHSNTTFFYNEVSFGPWNSKKMQGPSIYLTTTFTE